MNTNGSIFVLKTIQQISFPAVNYQRHSAKTLWWNGPEFLTLQQYELENLEDVPDEILLEMKQIVAMRAVCTEPFDFFSKFSSFRKMCCGYVLRFITNSRNNSSSERATSPHLTIQELRKSKETIFRVLQHIHFEDEIRRVISKQPC